MSTVLDPDAVRDALLDVLDATGAYPITRAAIIDAIREGARQAMADHLSEGEPS